jgi:hypothetical protein
MNDIKGRVSCRLERVNGPFQSGSRSVVSNPVDVTGLVPITATNVLTLTDTNSSEIAVRCHVYSTSQAAAQGIEITAVPATDLSAGVKRESNGPGPHTPRNWFNPRRASRS